MFEVDEGGEGAQGAEDDDAMLVKFVAYIKDHKVESPSARA